MAPVLSATLKALDMLPRSKGYGRLVFTQKDAGSNPAGSTMDTGEMKRGDKICRHCGRIIRFYHKYGFVQDKWIHRHSNNVACIGTNAEPR